MIQSPPPINPLQKKEAQNPTFFYLFLQRPIGVDGGATGASGGGRVLEQRHGEALPSSRLGGDAQDAAGPRARERVPAAGPPHARRRRGRRAHRLRWRPPHRRRAGIQQRDARADARRGGLRRAVRPPRRRRRAGGRVQAPPRHPHGEHAPHLLPVRGGDQAAQEARPGGERPGPQGSRRRRRGPGHRRQTRRGTARRRPRRAPPRGHREAHGGAPRAVESGPTGRPAAAAGAGATEGHRHRRIWRRGEDYPREGSLRRHPCRRSVPLSRLGRRALAGGRRCRGDSGEHTPAASPGAAIFRIFAHQVPQG